MKSIKMEEKPKEIQSGPLHLLQIDSGAIRGMTI